QDSAEPIQILSTGSIDEKIDNELKSKTLPTTTYTIPSKIGKISTQSLLTTSSSSTSNNQPASSNSFG
ncbi:unnamed protein product, partial [Rotaria magnacalcarata]